MAKNSFLKLIGFVFILMSFTVLAWARDMNCDVCGMSIPDKSKNHVVLKTDSADKKVMHICSLSCTKKVKKQGSVSGKFEVANFNHPEKFLDGDKAYFVVGGEKIKADLGDMVMPPYFGAFGTKKEADTAHKKYSDASVAQGLEKALK